MSTYSIRPSEVAPILKQLGISYKEETACPVVWHPMGWDENETRFEVNEVPKGTTAKEFTLAKTEDGSLMKLAELWNGVRFCHIRSQVFISEEADSSPIYVVFQPFKEPTMPMAPEPDNIGQNRKETTMNEQPLLDTSSFALLMINPAGLFYAEENDGRSTMPFWTQSPLVAHKFYRDPLSTEPIEKPSYYQSWPQIDKRGCRMVWVKINMTLWEKAGGPVNP